MDPHETWLKHWFEIPSAIVSALATVGAAIFAVRAYKAQAKQLKALEEDRTFAGLVDAPRFVPDKTGYLTWMEGNNWKRFYPRLSIQNTPPHVTVIDRLEFAGTEHPVWLQIGNQRNDVKIRGIHVTGEDGETPPIIILPRIGNEFFLVSYPESMAARRERARVKIYFETYAGIEGVHTYETTCGTLDFRRIHPPSIIDNAGIQFADNKGEQEN